MNDINQILADQTATEWELRECIKDLVDEVVKLRDLMSRVEPIINAAENLVKVKGRYHAEQAYIALVDAMIDVPTGHQKTNF